jgi:hypothetical protein
MVPIAGFFPAYLNWVKRLTDAPEPYHIASALSIMSAACSRLAEGRFEIQALDGTTLASTYPTSLWVLIVGPSGDRKSTAMDYAMSIGSASGAISDISAISGSPEATFDLVSKRPDIFFYHPEGSTLFAQLQASYWLQGQGFLCDLYDGREDPPYKRILTGQRSKKDPTPKTYEITIVKPRVTILIGIAPDLLDQARKSDWTGGLIGRMLLIYGERTRFDETPPKQDDGGRVLMTQLVQQLQLGLQQFLESAQKAAKATPGTKVPTGLQVGMQREALDAYMNWARDLDAMTASRPPKLRALFRRLPLHVMRISALYAISQFHDTVRLESMVPAIRLGEYSRKSIERVGDLLADDPIMRNAVRIRDMLEHAPGNVLTVAMISDALRISWSVIEPALRTLEANGRARIRFDPENTQKKWVELLV